MPLRQFSSALGGHILARRRENLCAGSSAFSGLLLIGGGLFLIGAGMLPGRVWVVPGFLVLVGGMWLFEEVREMLFERPSE